MHDSDSEYLSADERSATPAPVLPIDDSINIDEISPIAADWSREKKSSFWAWEPSRSLLASIRSYQCHRYRKSPWAFALKKLAVVRHRFWSVVCGADIPLNCRIEGGLLIPHPNGIVIHPEVWIGANCLIFQQVTIGVRHGHDAPLISGHVDIGAGAKILGDVIVGEHVLIGANAVVIQDVPPRSMAVGIPAVVKPIGVGEPLELV